LEKKQISFKMRSASAKHLVAMMAQIQAVFAQENLQGIELITSKEILLKFLDDAAAKLSALGVSKRIVLEPWMLLKILHRYRNRYPWFHTRAMAKYL
jgi:hypothetical protein